MTVGVPRLFTDNSINLDQKIEAFLIWSEFKAGAFTWVLLFVCLPATNSAQFNSRWPSWVATLRTNRLSVLVITPATNTAQFNSLWPNWVATLRTNCLSVLVITPATNSAQFNSRWPSWVATLRTNRLSVLVITPATNTAQFNSLWPSWVATRPPILSQNPLSIFFV